MHVVEIVLPGTLRPVSAERSLTASISRVVLTNHPDATEVSACGGIIVVAVGEEGS